MPEIKERKKSFTEMMIDARVASHRDATWVLFEDEKYSWADALSNIRKAANGLIDLGIKPGDRLGIMMGNSPDFLWIFFAATLLATPSVPINTAQRGNTLKHIITDSGIKVLVVDEPILSEIEPLLGELENCPLVISGSGKLKSATWSMDKLFDHSDGDPYVEIGNDSSNLFGILYTSGTTGPPKGVVSTGGSDAASIVPVMQSMGVKPGEVLYTALPLFHGNALGVSTFGSIVLDAQLALGRKFSASRLFDECRRFNAVEFNTLGAMVRMLLAQPPRDDDADNPVRTVLSAACQSDDWRVFEKRFGVNLVEFYGMVDSPGYLLNDSGRIGSMGKPVGSTEFEIVDENDVPVKPGEVGQLIFRNPTGPATMYHGQPEATENAYKNGWFHTGDLAMRDDEGFYYYRGRAKESIRRRGENISVWEIESVLQSYPGVSEVAAFAVPSELGEDEVMAVIVPIEGSSPDLDGVGAFCKGKMADYAIPRFVEVISEIPRTETQRIAYGALRSRGITTSTIDRIGTKK
ncbi:MAG: AMP-binding protein [Acidimicrobiales bacterium]|nr:AMP-binding protein [Acidimicrobiales bacterium]